MLSLGQGAVQGGFNPAKNPPLTAAYTPPLSGTFYYICVFSITTSADAFPRYKKFVPTGADCDLSSTAPGPGTYTVRLYDAEVGGNIVFESAQFTIPAPNVVLPGGTTPAASGTLYGVPSSAVAGTALSGITYATANVATPYAALVTSAATVGQVVGSALIGSAVALPGASGSVPAITPPAVGTVCLVLLDAPAGKVVTRSTPISVAAAGTPVSVTSIAFAPVSSVTANSAIETVIGTLTAQTSGGSLVNQALSLVSTASGNFKLIGSQLRFAVNNVPAGGYVIRARVTSDNAVVFEQDLAVTVAAAANPATQSNGAVTLTGMPSTIVAGQPLSAVTHSTASGAFFVLFRMTDAAEEGVRWPDGVMPGRSLSLLVPQTSGAYIVRAFDARIGGNLLYESTQISVTAAPGALPATPTQTADTGATSSSVTMNWRATGTSYRVLGRASTGAVYGSLVDTVVSTNSYNFTGLGFSGARAVIIAQNANGSATPTDQFLSSTA